MISQPPIADKMYVQVAKPLAMSWIQWFTEITNTVKSLEDRISALESDVEALKTLHAE